MNTARTHVPIQSDRPVSRTAFLVSAVLWLAVGGISRHRALFAGMMAWAFRLWAALLSAGFAVLAVTGSPQTRSTIRFSGALLAGLAVAFVGVTAKLGAPGRHNDYSEAQGWGVTAACALTAIVLVMLARPTSEAHSGSRSATLST